MLRLEARHNTPAVLPTGVNDEDDPPDAVFSLLDALGLALLVYAPDGRVVRQTPAAIALIRADAEEDRLRSAARRLATAASHPRAPRRHRDAGATEVVTALASYHLRAIIAPDEVFGRDAAAVVTIVPHAPPPFSDDVLRSRFRLTGREVEVARLMARGLNNADIAMSLGISAHTAERHTERVLRKLGLPSRAAVAAFLLTAGL